MKAHVLLPAILVLAAPFGSAQETYGTIRVTTKILEGGFKSTTITDPEKHTAEETVTYNDGKDTQGRIIPGKVLKKTTYLLGDGDIAVGAIFYDAKGAVVYKASYQRDAAGHVTEAAFSAPDGRYLGKRVFIYGAGGNNATQIVDYDADGQMIAQAQPVPQKSSKKKH